MPKEVKIMDMPEVHGSIWYSVDKGYLLKAQNASLSSLIGWILKNFDKDGTEAQINEYVRQNVPPEDMCFIASYFTPSGVLSDNL